MHTKSVVLLSCASVLLCACASGNTYKDVSRRIPSLALTQSRIYFYRAVTKDPEIQPAVSLNGEAVGVAKPHSFFFVDRDPGGYEVRAGGDEQDKLPLRLAPGQTYYVRFELRVGLQSDYLVPFENNEIDGSKEILPMEYIGPELPKHRPPRALHPR